MGKIATLTIRGAIIWAVLSASAAQAALITFNTVVTGQMSFGFDGDGDGVNDVIFSTTDPSGFNTAGPGANQLFIQEPGLEGTSLLNPDLRVDFLNGAVGPLGFGFALNSGASNPSLFANFQVFGPGNVLLGSDTEAGQFTTTPFGTSSFPEGLVEVNFPGIASFATFNFTSQFGRYIIDNFSGTFGSTEVITPSIPEPGTLALLAGALLGSRLIRRRVPVLFRPQPGIRNQCG